MALTKDQKTAILEDLVAKMKEAKSCVFANFEGLSVDDIQAMRGQLREKDVSFKVAKRTLIRLAAKEAGFGEISDEALDGSVGVAFANGDEIDAAKTLHAYSKENKSLELRGAIFEGRVLSVAETKELALLPGREELLGKFVFLLKSPIQGFHGVLNNTVSGFVRVLDAIREQKEQAA